MAREEMAREEREGSKESTTMTSRPSRSRYKATRILVAATAAGTFALGWAIIAAAGPRAPLTDPLPADQSTALVSGPERPAGLAPSSPSANQLRDMAPAERQRASRGS
ncbi:hypothetical protein [Tepidiforma sp.]|uniref:hypothetical protein n=1 Tax=Tepidiforma sp. TaxID=2682230 RepID=UPI002ADDDE1D|nr:hypothetical protein [Tepidiforma sp.]